MSLSQLACGQRGLVPTLILCAPKDAFGMRKEQKNPVKILSHSLYAKRVTKFKKFWLPLWSTWSPSISG